jgi:predicted amidohydrolase YtcJ
MRRWFMAVVAAGFLCGNIELCYEGRAQGENLPVADLIVHNARVVTVNKDFTISQAVASQGDRIVAVGKDEAVMKHRGPKTKVIDAHGKTVLPGLYDSHVHAVAAATSELVEPVLNPKSLQEVFDHIRARAKVVPEGEWIVLRFIFPTRLKEARFPTKAELDEAAPKHPVMFHAGPASMVNTMALTISKITKDTPNPTNGVIVKDPKTGEPTGMIRNAYSALKKIPSTGKGLTTQARLDALKKLFRLYNQQGITSVADRNASRGELDLFYTLLDNKELTIRLNVARSFSPYGTAAEIAKRLKEMPGKDGLGGPTGKGGVWIRIGPIKFFLDGGMLNGTAFMREPWPPGPTYQIVEKDYHGLLFVKPEQVKVLALEAAKQGWQITAHTAGEAAMDVLLDAYDFVDRQIPIKEKRFCITHANFPSKHNLERCKALGVCADVQPVWLYKDGVTLSKVLGPNRIKWFQPFKTWLEYTVIGGGSDHMLKLDPNDSINPWNPWLGMSVAVTRKTEQGSVLNAAEALSREQALRLYTIHNAFLHHEENDKGSLETGRLADLIVIDRDFLTCPAEDISQTRVLYTIVGGRVVYEAEK